MIFSNTRSPEQLCWSNKMENDPINCKIYLKDISLFLGPAIPLTSASDSKARLDLLTYQTCHLRIC